MKQDKNPLKDDKVTQKNIYIPLCRRLLKKKNAWAWEWRWVLQEELKDPNENGNKV